MQRKWQKGCQTAAADRTAKAAAGYREVFFNMIQMSSDPITLHVRWRLKRVATNMSRKGSDGERTWWNTSAELASRAIKAHTPEHCSVKATISGMVVWWHHHMEVLVKDYVSSCKICPCFDPKKAAKTMNENFSSTGSSQLRNNHCLHRCETWK